MESKNNNSDFNSFLLNLSQSFHILDSMIDFVRILDIEGLVLYENRSLQNYCYRELLSTVHATDTYLGISTRLMPPALSADTLEKGVITTTELSVKSRVFSVKSTPVFDRDNRVQACVEVFRDITEANNLTVQLYLDNQKIQQEMRLARSIQTSMLPEITDFGEIHFDYRYIPSDELSGDFFDLIPLGAGRLGLYITDVVGHGISASILTMFVRQTMRNILEEEKITEPASVLKKMRKRFNEMDLDEGQYFSLFYAVIDTVNRTLTYANAGHNCPPILFRYDQVEQLECTGMLISNIFESYDYKQKTMGLERGYRFLFFTDGIIETENENHQAFGYEKLEEILLEKPDRLLDRIVQELSDFRAGDQKDDIALLLVETPRML